MMNIVGSKPKKSHIMCFPISKNFTPRGNWQQGVINRIWVSELWAFLDISSTDGFTFLGQGSLLSMRCFCTMRSYPPFLWWCSMAFCFIRAFTFCDAIDKQTDSTHLWTKRYLPKHTVFFVCESLYFGWHLSPFASQASLSFTWLVAISTVAPFSSCFWIGGLSTWFACCKNSLTPGARWCFAVAVVPVEDGIWWWFTHPYYLR